MLVASPVMLGMGWRRRNAINPLILSTSTKCPAAAPSASCRDLSSSSLAVPIPPSTTLGPPHEHASAFGHRAHTKAVGEVAGRSLRCSVAGSVNHSVPSPVAGRPVSPRSTGSGGPTRTRRPAWRSTRRSRSPRGVSSGRRGRSTPFRRRGRSAGPRRKRAVRSRTTPRDPGGAPGAGDRGIGSAVPGRRRPTIGHGPWPSARRGI